MDNGTITEVTENQPQIVQVQSLNQSAITAGTTAEQQMNQIQHITLQQPAAVQQQQQQSTVAATQQASTITPSQQPNTTQVIQQVLTPSGEVQNIPVSTALSVVCVQYVMGIK